VDSLLVDSSWPVELGELEGDANSVEASMEREPGFEDAKDRVGVCEFVKSALKGEVPLSLDV
jgi:hypothetical protein